MALTPVPLTILTVSAVTSKAAGVLTFASTTGIYKGALVDIQCATSGYRCRVLAVTAATLVLGDDIYGRPLNLANAAIGDKVVMCEQMVDVKPWDLAVTSSAPSRAS